MTTAYKPEVTVRELGDGPQGTKRFCFLWQEPNPKYGNGSLHPLVERQKTRCFIGWSSANQFAELQERHLARVYAKEVGA